MHYFLSIFFLLMHLEESFGRQRWDLSLKFVSPAVHAVARGAERNKPAPFNCLSVNLLIALLNQ